MKMPTNVQHRARVLLPLLILFIAGGDPLLWSAPPDRRDVVPQGLEKVGDFFFKIARKLEHAGRVDVDDDRDIEIIYDGRRLDVRRVPVDPRDEAAPGLRVPPGSYPAPAPQARPYPRNEPVTPPGFVPYEERSTPPNFQPRPQPRLEYPNNSKSNGRSELEIPVNPSGTDPSDERPTARQRSIEPGKQGPFEPPTPLPERSKSNPATKSSSNSAPEDKTASPSGELGFATPVPGHAGFVYPPGVEKDLKNMLDVRDFSPGQKVKDPRTGKMFLVPAK